MRMRKGGARTWSRTTDTADGRPCPRVKSWVAWFAGMFCFCMHRPIRPSSACASVSSTSQTPTATPIRRRTGPPPPGSWPECCPPSPAHLQPTVSQTHGRPTHSAQTQCKVAAALPNLAKRTLHSLFHRKQCVGRHAQGWLAARCNICGVYYALTSATAVLPFDPRNPSGFGAFGSSVTLNTIGMSSTDGGLYSCSYILLSKYV